MAAPALESLCQGLLLPSFFAQGRIMAVAAFEPIFK